MTTHEVITCLCPNHQTCPVPGHGNVPITVDPQVLVDAGQDALKYVDVAVQAVLAARAAWVSRGLPGDNPLPVSLDRLAGRMTMDFDALRLWVEAAKTIAARHLRKGS